MSDSLPDPMSESGDEPAALPGAVPLPVDAESGGLRAGAGNQSGGSASEAAEASMAARTPVLGMPSTAPGDGAPGSGGAAAGSRATKLLLILRAVGDPVRYRLLGELAGGEVLTVAGMARRLKAHPDTMGKHVKVLRRAGVLCRVKREGADGRVKEFQIPAEFRATAGVLDFGVCRVQLGL